MPRNLESLVAVPDSASGRTRLIAGNWKMHMTHLEAIAHAEQLFHRLRPEDFRYAQIALCPPFTALRSLQLLFESDRMPFFLGAQNVSEHPEGAFTGEISVSMLAKLGVAFVIVGHSERRRYFQESSELVATKAARVAGAGMRAVVCVGEEATAREHREEVLTSQLEPVLKGFPAARLGELVVAYEPVWAIGAGTPASPEEIDETTGWLRRYLVETIGASNADGVRILYGGSVDVGNARSFTELPEVDGLLVGGASLDADRFAELIKAA
jgi:triosephosphate isomerase